MFLLNLIYRLKVVYGTWGGSNGRGMYKQVLLTCYGSVIPKPTVGCPPHHQSSSIWTQLSDLWIYRGTEMLCLGFPGGVFIESIAGPLRNDAKTKKKKKSLPHIYSPLQTFPVILNTNVTQKCAHWKGLNNRPCAGSTEECVVKPVQWLQDLLPKHENFIRKKTFFHTWNATGCELGLQISQFNVQINWGKSWLFKPVWAQIHLPCTFEQVWAQIHQNTWRAHSLVVSESVQCQVPNFESF